MVILNVKEGNWGWSRMPLGSKLLCGGVLLNIIAFGTPLWVYFETQTTAATFGLFHYCLNEHGAECTSIHDNVVEGRIVPDWFRYLQGCYFVGVACGVFAACIVHANTYYKRIVMPNTLMWLTLGIIGIGVCQQSLCIYLFVTFFDDTDFLYQDPVVLEFYGGYYCAIVGTAMETMAALMILAGEDEATLKKQRLKEERFKELRAKTRMYYILNMDKTARTKGGVEFMKKQAQLKFLEKVEIKKQQEKKQQKSKPTKNVICQDCNVAHPWLNPSNIDNASSDVGNDNKAYVDTDDTTERKATDDIDDLESFYNSSDVARLPVAVVRNSQTVVQTQIRHREVKHL